jgi:hypothetical protein
MTVGVSMSAVKLFQDCHFPETQAFTLQRVLQAIREQGKGVR